ncbi:MAG: YihA family ribosome biogenesis GTP-binding protein [Legionellales bacterium]|nr:MAG: YihA family ribosome biogenesis GTP-binding protein [Legionellales bacterium]
MAILQQIKFLTSAATLKQLPEDSGCEIAFMGRSNSGKSSTINALTNIKRLAYTSKTPGRTQLLNFFQVDGNSAMRLVDLPGYGYAKASLNIKKSWQKVLSEYLQSRQSLCGIVLITDIRRGITAGDENVIKWCQDSGMPLHILCNKVDKLSYSQAKRAMQDIRNTLPATITCTMQTFSALRKTGVDDAKITIHNWLQGN